jgi:membrane-bound serine protease (ClpP class)
VAVVAAAAVLWMQTAPDALAASEATDQPTSAPSSTATMPEAISRAYILPIRDEISDITYDSLKRRLGTIPDGKPQLIVIELDTPGGALLATLKICDMLKGLRDDGVKVYAWVNNEAYSAGTIIALAADGIVMSRNATIGDCQPIQISPEGGAEAVPKDIEAKAIAPLKAELEDSARRNGYSYDMLLALIDPSKEMFWLVNAKTGEKRFADAAGRDRLFGLTRESQASGGGLLGFLRGDDKGGKEERDLVPDSLSKTDWKYVKEDPRLGHVRQPIDGPNDLLTMRTDKAIAFGFASAVVNNESDLRGHFNITGSLIRLENNWPETVIEWLASPIVRGVLFLVMLLAAYAEFHTPGFGLAGAVALACLVVFLGAPYLAGYTVTWEIVAIVLGIILLAVELFVIPGFGIVGIIGLLLMGVGLVASFAPAEPGFERNYPSWPTLPGTYRDMERGLYVLAGALAGGIVGMYILARYLPKVPLAGRLIAPNPVREAVQMDDPYPNAAQTGDLGTAETLLRPAGKARFGSTLVDVVSEGEYIQSGSRVMVVERRGNRVVVRRVE